MMSEAEALLDSLEGRGIVAVSPHPDDLALSAGGFLSLLVRRARVSVITCFSRSLWSPYLDPASADVETISLVRRAEEEAFWKELGADGLFLDFDDAGLRGYEEKEELGAKPADDPLWPAFRRRFEAALDATRCDVILCPLSLGDHVDHLMVHSAATGRGGRPPYQLFYEDLPYAAELSDSDIRERVAERVVEPRPVIFPLGDSFDRKLSYLACYPSQISWRESEVIYHHARRVSLDSYPCERLWVSRASINGRFD